MQGLRAAVPPLCSAGRQWVLSDTTASVRRVPQWHSTQPAALNSLRLDLVYVGTRFTKPIFVCTPATYFRHFLHFE